MNVEQFKQFFGGVEFPIELGYGYTLNRETLHINLYEDKLSRILTDSYGNTLERIDQVENIHLPTLLYSHKRFYPNRVNSIFLDLIRTFGGDISITTQDSNSQPIFEFGEVLENLPTEEIPVKYFKMNPESEHFQHYMSSNHFHFYFLEDEKMGNNIYLVGDARKNYGNFEGNYLEISKEEYEEAKEFWQTLNTIGNYKVVPHWTIVGKDNQDVPIMDSSASLKEIQEEWKNLIDKDYNIALNTHLKRGYVILDHLDEVVEPLGVNYGFYLNHEDALMRAYKIKHSGMEDKERKYFISINDEDTEKYWVYYHNVGTFETETEIRLVNENIPGDDIMGKKENFKEIKEYQYYAILNSFALSNPNIEKIVEKVLGETLPTA